MAAQPSSQAPGLSIEHVARMAAAPSAPADAVPVFVGFGVAADSDRSDISTGNGYCAGHLVRWDAAFFDQALRPAKGSFLRGAIRGFFANGGRECFVVAVSPDGGAASRTETLLKLFRPFGPLTDLEQVDLVCVPDAVSSLVPDDDDRLRIQLATLEHCASGADRFAILDAPLNLTRRESHVRELRDTVQPLRSEFGALYFPWLIADASPDDGPAPSNLAAEQQWRSFDVTNPPADVRYETVPPCGHVAAVYARRTGSSAGYRAPANMSLNSVLDTSRAISEAERALLNDAGVNCITARKASGVQVMGARTLSGLDRYRYVSGARVLIGLRRWLRRNMADLVFESNTPVLWDRIRRRLLAHCLELWRAGALAADATQPEAFVVQCDAETNTLDSTERAQVIAHVSLAPTTPAEFIKVRIIHDAAGYSVSAS